MEGCDSYMKRAIKNKVTIVFAALAVAFVFSATAHAVPSLQVYIPGAVYDEGEQSWITTDTDFEVWVIASQPLYGVQLTASLGDSEDPYAGTLDIGGTSYTGADFTSGDHTHLAPHSIFPTDWLDHAVGDMTTMTPNTIADFTSGYDHGVTPLDKSGQIIKFNVSITGFRFVHFDAWGFDGDDQYHFAPFSHDGGTAVPEPATALLFTLGAAGMGVARRFRKK